MGRDRPTHSYLDFNISNFGCRSNDGPPNKRREDMLWEVGAGISTLDKLHKGEKKKKRETREDEKMPNKAP